MDLEIKILVGILVPALMAVAYFVRIGHLSRENHIAPSQAVARIERKRRQQMKMAATATKNK